MGGRAAGCVEMSDTSPLWRQRGDVRNRNLKTASRSAVTPNGRRLPASRLWTFRSEVAGRFLRKFDSATTHGAFQLRHGRSSKGWADERPDALKCLIRAHCGGNVGMSATEI